MRKTLRRGGAVHLAADGPVGNSGVTVTFFGEPRRFGLGFASLAATTRAPVVPVFAALEPGGRVRVEFLPALAPPDAELPRGERHAALVQSYAQVLEVRWRSDPELIMPGGPVPLRSGRNDRGDA